MLKKLSIAVRGNPAALATLLVSTIFFVLGFLLRKPDESLIASAMVGAAVSSMVSLITGILAEPELKAIPAEFRDAARADFDARGYYRSDNKLDITFAGNSLTFHMTSRIVRFRDGATMKALNVNPPANLTIVQRSYSIDGVAMDLDAELVLKPSSKESLTIVYALGLATIASDTHAWDCPVEGFRLCMSAPAGYHVSALTLSNRVMDEEGEKRDCNRTFIEPRAALSRQGFIWTIRKIA